MDQKNYVRSYNQVKSRVAEMLADTSGRAVIDEVKRAHLVRQPGILSQQFELSPNICHYLQMAIVGAKAELTRNMAVWYWKTWCDASEISVSEFLNNLMGKDKRLKTVSDKPWWRFW